MASTKEVAVLLTLFALVAVAFSQVAQGGSHSSQGGPHENQGRVRRQADQRLQQDNQSGQHGSQNGQQGSQSGEQQGVQQGDDDDVQDVNQVNSKAANWTSCDITTTPVISCYDCNTRLICKPLGGLLLPCKNPFRPYCYNGICSPLPGPECS